jgi:hypothetical protein
MPIDEFKSVDQSLKSDTHRYLTADTAFSRDGQRLWVLPVYSDAMILC